MINEYVYELVVLGVFFTVLFWLMTHPVDEEVTDVLGNDDRLSERGDAEEDPGK